MNTQLKEITTISEVIAKKGNFSPQLLAKASLSDLPCMHDKQRRAGCSSQLVLKLQEPPILKKQFALMTSF